PHQGLDGAHEPGAGPRLVVPDSLEELLSLGAGGLGEEPRERLDSRPFRFEQLVQPINDRHRSPFLPSAPAFWVQQPALPARPAQVERRCCVYPVACCAEGGPCVDCCDQRKGECAMKVHKPDEIPAQPVNPPLFTGGAVTRQTLLTPEASEYFNLGIVNFAPGARNKMHTHSSDQVLFVTAGKGIIATETEQQIITTGDVVHIPSEEKHWHGATHDSAFSHIALTAKGSTTTQVEQ